MRNRRLRKEGIMLKFEKGCGYHRHCRKWEVMFYSPLKNITENDANISNLKRREQNLY